MKKKILIFVFTFMLLFFSTEFVEAAKKQYVCYYSNGKIDAQFRLRLEGGMTKAETASITDDPLGETVINWKNAMKGTNFTGRVYYAKNTVCPPYAYYFNTTDWFGPMKFLVSDEPAGGDFESKLKEAYKVKGDIHVLKFTGTKEEEEKEENLPTSCMDFNEVGDSSAKLPADKYSCQENPYFSCVWNKTTANPDGGYCNTDNLQYVKCGDSFDIPKDAPRLISFFVNFLKILAPILLIILSIITLLKALAASNEDQIKKAQKSLISKIIAAVMVFFVVSIVQFVIMKVADSGETDAMSKCLSCFLNNDCEDNIYYKTNVGGEYFCTGINGDSLECGENVED